MRQPRAYAARLTAVTVYQFTNGLRCNVHTDQDVDGVQRDGNIKYIFPISDNG